MVKDAEAALNITGQRRSIITKAQGDEDGLPDPIPENLAQEIHETTMELSSWGYEVICSPLWGCGAFGGDPYVKVALL